MISPCLPISPFPHFPISPFPQQPQLANSMLTSLLPGIIDVAW